MKSTMLRRSALAIAAAGLLMSSVLAQAPGTGVIVRGPGQRNIDMAVERTIPIAEGHNIHIRAEFFNLINTANFSNPMNNLSAGSAFGVMTSTATNPRIIQLALKFEF